MKSSKTRYLLIPGPTQVAIPTQARSLSRKDKQQLADILYTHGFTVDGEHFNVSRELAEESIASGRLVQDLPEGAVMVEDYMSEFGG